MGGGDDPGSVSTFSKSQFAIRERQITVAVRSPSRQEGSVSNAQFSYSAPGTWPESTLSP